MTKTRKLPKAKPYRAPSAPVVIQARRAKQDGWENVNTGFGSAGIDKRLGSTFALGLITQDYAEHVWRGDDIAARIVEVIPDEMLREGFEVCIEEDEEGADAPDNEGEEGEPKEEAPEGDEPKPTPYADAFPQGGFGGKPKPGAPAPADDEEAGLAADKEADEKAELKKAARAEKDKGKKLAEDIESEARKLDVVECVRRALYYSRAYGGAGILIGADDGTKNLELPLAEDRIKKFEWLTVFTPKELVPERRYADPKKPKYNEISHYRLVPTDSPPEATVRLENLIVHESRIIRINGVQTSRWASINNSLPGWDDSVFVRVLQAVNDFQAAWQATSILIQDFAPAVLKIAGLAKLLAGTNAADTSIKTRARAVEQGRSVARVTIIDEAEDFKRETTNVLGLSDLLEKLTLRTAAAARMPVSLLMGQAPAGLNATGDSDIRWFYDQVAAMQERTLRPALMRILKLLFLSKSGPAKGKEPTNWDIKFNPLWQLTELEQAEVREKQANVDKVYLESSVITPEEVALSRFGGDGYSTETQIDMDLRDELAADSAHQEQRLGAPTPEDIELKKAEIEGAKKGAMAEPGGPPGNFPKGKQPGKKPPFGK